MIYKQFLDTFLGESWGYPDNNKYKGECLSIAKIYIKECFGIEPPPSGTNSAYGYWSNFPNPLGEKFEKVENTDSLIPEKGWIAIWKPWDTNKYGHIAIVKDGNLKTFNSYDQNWGTKNFVEIKHDYTNVIGFLKPKSSIIDDMTDDQKRALTILEQFKIEFNHGNLEGASAAATNASRDIPKKDKQISDLSSSVATMTSKIGELEAKIAELEKNGQSWQSELSTAKENIQTIQEQLDTMTSEKNKFKGYYETALKDQVNKYTGWQLIRLGVKKLSIKK